jgi:mRNA interferase RelE/StbE
MEMYPIIYSSQAEKYLKKIKDRNLKKLFKDAIEKIRKNPYEGNMKKGDLKGIHSVDIFYNRTNYELAYRISELANGDIIVVIMAGTQEYKGTRLLLLNSL